MYNIGIIIFNGVMVLATLWIIRRFLNTFFEKKQHTVFSIFVWGMYGAFQVFVQMNSGAASYLTTILCILFVILISAVSYCDFGKTNILIILLLHAAWALVEMMTFFCMSILPLEKESSDMIGTVISKIVMIISVYVFSLVWKGTNNNLIPPKYYAGLLFVPVGSIYIAVAEFFTKSNSEDVISSMIIFSILLLFNIIILEIYSKISENFMLEKEKAIYEQQIIMMSTNTEEQKKIMESFHREKHDLKNKLIVIKHELENGDNEEVLMNIDEIIQNCGIGEAICNSGNKVIDALINVKYAIAKEMGIEFVLKIFIPEDLPINQCDMGIILGNALDNAIEATEKCRHNKKEIDIIMGIKKESLVLVVKNPYEDALKTDKAGNLVTTKKESRLHGYGISSIRRVAEKYHGDVLVEDEEGQFVLTVTMNLGEL